jgi:putative NADPH-quinone reductase
LSRFLVARAKPRLARHRTNTVEKLMNVLIVHAHHEPLSFSSALKNRAVEVLSGQGHKVDVSDLYAMRFEPVSGRHNFTTVRDAGYLKQQQEELHATRTAVSRRSWMRR